MMMGMKASAVALCLLVALAGPVSCRELQQQQQQQGGLDLGGLLSQVGQVAQQGAQALNTAVQQNQQQQGQQQGQGGNRPLGNIGDTLQNLGAQLNNRTGAAAPAPAPAPAAAGNRTKAPPAAGGASAGRPDDGMLAPASEIATNVSSGISTFLGNLSAGATNRTGTTRPSQGGYAQPITPPTGVKSGAGAAAASHLAGLAAAALLLAMI